MPDGFKIADAYAEIRADKDPLRADVAGLGAELGAAADAAGQQLGDRLTKGLAAKVATLSGQVAKAQVAEKKATDDVTLAETRLNEARQDGNVKGSALLALEQRLSQARDRLTLATSKSESVTRKYAQAQQDLSTAIVTAAQRAEADAQRGGEDVGDKLSRGMQMSLVRNAPLIAAGISAALALGAPAAIAAATALFAGIGIAAAAQSQQVRSAWAGTWDNIKQGAQQDASVLVPVLTGAATQIGNAFTAMRPQLRDAFSTAAPEIDGFVTSVVRASQYAMPGLMASVRNSQPVMQGLDSLVESVGKGLGSFFTQISSHGNEAGGVLKSLGSIVQSLLQILGEFLADGTGLASAVLPAMASALQVLASVLHVIEPVLPLIVAGFTGMKVASAVAGWVGSAEAALGRFAASAAAASSGSGLFAGAAGKIGAAASGAKGALSSVGGALPIIGVALAGVTIAFEKQKEQVDAWGKALADGGAEATQARAEIEKYNQLNQVVGTGVQGLIGKLTGYGTALNVISQDSQKAKEAQDAYLKSLSPLERAQQDVTKAQNDYLEAVNRWGSTSGQAIGASVAYRDAQQHEKDVEDQLSKAIHGVTQAMIDQANEALAAADSTFALQQDVLATKDAEVAMKQAIEQHGAASEDAQKATIAFGQALLQQAEAAGKAAADASGLTDQTDLTRVSQQATLKSLLDLKAQYGAEFPAALQQTIDRLQAAGVKLDDVGAKQPTPTVNLNDGPFQGIYNYVTGAINQLNGRAPTPTAFMNDQPFQGAASYMNSMLSYLAGRNIAPSATLIANTLAAENSLNYAARNRISYVTQIYRPGGNNSAYAAAGGGKVGQLRGKKMSIGGRVAGPGGPTDDQVGPFMSDQGLTYLSNGEEIIKASSRALYGDQRMAAVNAGTATILLPGEAPQRMAGGGAVIPAAAAATGGSGSTSIVVNVNVPPGAVLISDRDLPPMLITAVQQGLLKKDRSAR